MILFFGLVLQGSGVDPMENAGEVQARGFPVFDAGAGVEQVGTADQLVERAHTQLSHDLAYLLGHEKEEIHHMLGFALEFLAQYRSEEHTSELQSLMRISYAVFCLKKKTKI